MFPSRAWEQGIFERHGERAGRFMTITTADHWKLRTQTLDFGELPLLMGIVNVTPDSFSDGGRSCNAEQAVDRAMRLADEGADILDIGGESTRPGADPVDAKEELCRVMPVLERLRAKTHLPLSIDTSKAAVAAAAIEAGVEIINDVTALQADPDLMPLAVESGCGICLMHIQGTPRTMQIEPRYDDVVAEVGEYLRNRRDALLAAGAEQDRIALDPGIGFGKTTRHNIQLLAGIGRLHEFGCTVLVGHSRKRFLADPTEGWGTAGRHPPRPLTIEERLPGTIGAAMSLARCRVQVLRVHDIAPLRQALLVFQATGGLG